MEEKSLDTEDRKFLKAETTQALLRFVVMIIPGLIVGIGLILYFSSTTFAYGREIVLTVFPIGYLILLIVLLWPRIQELRRGLKGITTTVITDKKQNILHTASGEPMVDFTTQPRLIECYFTFNNQDVLVEKKYYDQFNINDRIVLHYSLRTGCIINITKG